VSVRNRVNKLQSNMYIDRSLTCPKHEREYQLIQSINCEETGERYSVKTSHNVERVMTSEQESSEARGQAVDRSPVSTFENFDIV
jgi:hypothetical protein